jgi:hypothetical protein
MTKNDRMELLQQAQQQIYDAIANIELALEDTNYSDYAGAYIIGHLNNWADAGGYDMGIQQYIDGFEEGEIYVKGEGPDEEEDK